MQISNIFSQLQDAKTWGKSAQSSDAAVSRSLSALTERSSSALNSNSAVGKILAQYDVSDITPKQFSEMVQKLRDTGSLDDADLRELTQIRSDLDASGIKADEKVNLLTYYQQRLHTLQSQGQKLDSGSTEAATVKQSMASVQRRLDWAQKLATMHETSDAMGLDATA